MFRRACRGSSRGHEETPCSDSHRGQQGAPRTRAAQASNKCKSVHSCGNAGDCDLGYQLLCSTTSLYQHAPCIIPPRTHCPNRGMRAPTWERQHPGPARLNRHGPYAVCRAAAAFIETHSTGLQLSARALRLSAPPLASVPLCPGKSARTPEEDAHRPGVAVATAVAAATAALVLPAPPSSRRRRLHRPAAVAASATTLCPGEGARAPEERTRS